MSETAPLLRLRPLSFGELLDDVFRIYRRHFWLLATLSLLVALPPLLIQLASGSANQIGFTLSLLSHLGDPRGLEGARPPGGPNPVLVAGGYLVFIVVVPFTVAAVPAAVIDVVLGRGVTVGSALLHVLHRYWALFGLTALYVLVSPLLLCFPVAIWLYIRWAIAVPAMLAEGVGPLRALDRSWVLTRASWWRLFGVLLLIYLLTAVISGALGVFAFPVAIVIPFIPEGMRGAIVLTIESVAGAVVQPALYLCLTLLYFDLRIRREHFDLDQLALRAVVTPP
jgi:hypothetical protein